MQVAAATQERLAAKDAALEAAQKAAEVCASIHLTNLLCKCPFAQMPLVHLPSPDAAITACIPPSLLQCWLGSGHCKHVPWEASNQPNGIEDGSSCTTTAQPLQLIAQGCTC